MAYHQGCGIYKMNHKFSLSGAPFIALSVAGQSTVTYSSSDPVILLPHVLSNVYPDPPGWNPDTNKFTCPYNGTYFLMATVYKLRNYGDLLLCIKSDSNGNVVCANLYGLQIELC